MFFEQSDGDELLDGEGIEKQTKQTTSTAAAFDGGCSRLSAISFSSTAEAREIYESPQIYYSTFVPTTATKGKFNI